MADRRRAVEAAVAWGREGDVVVIAGKGHETYQIIGTESHEFDDREVARTALRARGGAGGQAWRG
jgi:UDP-N-acetylmuramoyl-L-alanyl-D-glutamate--2,6-diaminopimelate ligase